MLTLIWVRTVKKGDFDAPDKDKLLTHCLFFTNGNWEMHSLNYKIKSKIVPVTGNSS